MQIDNQKIENFKENDNQIKLINSLIEKEFDNIRATGLNLENVKEQLLFIQNKRTEFVEHSINISQGHSKENNINLISAITKNYGITNISEHQNSNNHLFENLFTKQIENFNVCKFVPASGASSRMFAFLIKYYDTIKNNKKNELSENELKQVNYFFDNLEDFAFNKEFFEILNKVNKLKILEAKNEKSNRIEILELILFTHNDIGLNLSQKLKGQVKFHKLKTHQIKSNYINFHNISDTENVEPIHLNAFQSHILEVILLCIKTENYYSLEQFLFLLNKIITIEFSISEELYNNFTLNSFQNSELNTLLSVFSFDLFKSIYNINTISYNDFELFNSEVIEILKSKIKWSVQDKKTNSLALIKNEIKNSQNDLQLLKDENGFPITRAAGHGALIKNIQNINEEYIFIKNIDNITKFDLLLSNNQKIKEIIGITAFFKDKIDKYISELQLIKTRLEVITTFHSYIDNEHIYFIKEAAEFIKSYIIEDFELEYNPITQHKLNLEDYITNTTFFETQKEINENIFFELDSYISHIITLLDRPLRVCGMVRNTGEPGGGPFYIKMHNKIGSTSKSHFNLYNSKQIIELSQINLKNENQLKIVESAEYFNPVYMVLNFTKYDKTKYELNEFIDSNMAMIVEKTHGSNNILSYEYPGLWNGSMAYWNTIFVEMPIDIFHPVKTVNDLLKSGHFNK